MKASRNSRRATRRALKQATNRIRWADGPERSFWRTPTFGVIAAGVAITGVGIVTAHKASADPRLADPGCDIYTVQPGDNLSKIARSHGFTVDTIIGWNPQITNPSLIYVDDQVCVGRSGVERLPGVNEVQKVAPVVVAPQVEWPGFNPFIPGEVVQDGVVSQGLILRALYDAGARGNALIGIAAVTECESNRRLNAEGDHDLRDQTWDVSLTPWQIRGAKNQQGKGTARDVDALRADPVRHGAAAAVEIYQAALAKGRDPLAPWTCHLNRNDRAFVAPYTELARQMGLLDGGAR